jgi:hypothetical protein
MKFISGGNQTYDLALTKHGHNSDLSTNRRVSTRYLREFWEVLTSDIFKDKGKISEMERTKRLQMILTQFPIFPPHSTETEWTPLIPSATDHVSKLPRNHRTDYNADQYVEIYTKDRLTRLSTLAKKNDTSIVYAKSAPS